MENEHGSFTGLVSVHLGGDTRTVDTFHNCRKLRRRKGSAIKLSFYAVRRLKWHGNAVKLIYWTHPGESHAEFLKRSLFWVIREKHSCGIMMSTLMFTILIYFLSINLRYISKNLFVTRDQLFTIDRFEHLEEKSAFLWIKSR